MKAILTFFFSMLQICTFSQTVRLSGTVFDKETGMPVSGISIYTKDNKTGTISTSKGNFSLEIPVAKTRGCLYFSSVEYETDSVLISKVHSPLSIQLTPKIYTLKEVYIMPDSTLLTLLRKAYNKIPENYPERPTRYEGFFQESTSNEEDGLVELIEAVLSVYKESYKEKKEAPGQIEILKSRIKQFQNVKAGFIGGAFMAVNKDVVLQRSSFINPKRFKNYQYEFAGIKTLNEKDYYEIGFHPASKDSDNVRGTMLIDMQTLAYVSFDIKINRPGNAQKIIGPINPVESNAKIKYEQLNGKWYLKQVSGNNKHDHWRFSTPLYSSLDFIATTIQTDSVKPIPVEKRLEYLDPIESKTESYNSKGWTDSDILANEEPNQLDFQFSPDEAAGIFRQNSSKKISFGETMIKIVPKLIMGVGINYDPNLQLSAFQSVLGYRFNKNWNIRWQSSEDIFDKRFHFSENSLGIDFRKNLNNAGYPVFLGTSLWITDKNYDGKYNFREQTITPQLAVSKRISYFITLEVFANYPVAIHSKGRRDVSGYSPNFGVMFYVF